MSTALAPYNALSRSLATVTTIEAAGDLCRKAELLHTLWRKATDSLEPEIRAAELRIRAERRLGELMLAYRKEGLIRPGNPMLGRTDEGARRITLVDAGIDERLGDRARKLAALPVSEFEARIAARREAIERGDKRVSVFVHKAGLADTKAEAWAAREAALGGRILAFPNRRYGVILADPEWAFEPWSMETGQDRAAANHYPVSSLATLCARDVASIAADDCLLALWATVPMLAEAFAVLDAWGFSRFDRDPETGHLTLDKSRGRYVSSGCWTKYRPGTGIGMGHWFRVDHEILLLATRGHVPGPAPGSQPRSVFDVPASRVHSQKPELVLEMLEGYFPTVPKIELNRRGRARPGWDAWGDEVLGEVA